VLEKVAELDIQVDNLIQFLPQDRVAEFAQLAPPEVLKETEKATGGAEMLEKHKELIELKKQENSSKTDLDAEKEKLETEKRRNEAIEPEVMRVREKRTYQQKIELIKKKRPWVEYDKARQEYFEAREARAAKQEALKKAEEENKPMKKKIDDADRELKEADEEKKKYANEYKKIFDEIGKKDKAIEQEENGLDDIKRQLEELKQTSATRQKQIKGLELQIKALQSKIADTPKIDFTEINKKIEEISGQLRELQNLTQEVQVEIKSDKDEIKKLTTDTNNVQRKLEQLENTQNQRLENLKREQRDTYNAVTWLREHRDLFKDEVYEPIVLTINVKNPRYANHIEMSIPRNYLFAFVCRSEDDQHTLISNVSQQQKLKINSITVSQGDMGRYQKPPVDKLRRYGFQHVLLDLIEAPDDIKLAFVSKRLFA